MVVSHDRYFLDRVARRLLILQPPGITDFGDTYSAWQQKLKSDAASEKAAATERAKQQQRGKGQTSTAKAPEPKSQQPKKKDNPYARPFGRLTMKELESQITEAEVAIAEVQENMGNAETFRDASKGKRLQEELKTLSKKLEGLEAEYFEREK